MVALALFAAGCGGSSDSEELAQVRAELAQASAELDALKEQVATITAAPATTAAPTTTAIPTITPAPTTTLVPIWDGPHEYRVTVIESGSLEAVVVGDVVLVERAGWRARRSVLVPESWVLEIIDGGGSGGGATWTNPLDPRERVRVGTGVSRGVWYERDGIDEVVPPAIPKGSIVEEIKPWTYLYEEVADGVTTTGIVEATFPNSPTATQPCCFQHASISLSKPDTAVVSAFVEFLLEPPEEVSTEGQRETSRMRFGFPATVNGVTVGLMRQTIASAGSTPVNYTMDYPFVQLHLNQYWLDEAVSRQIEQSVNTWIRGHVNTQVSEFLENTIPRYQENILVVRRQILGQPVGTAWLGIGGETPTDGRTGALLVKVVEGSPADQAGLQVDDRIFRSDGRDIRDMSSLKADIQIRRSGERVDLEYERDGVLGVVEVQLGAVDDHPLNSQANYRIEVNTSVNLNVFESTSVVSIYESWSGEANGTTLCPCPEFGYAFDLSDGGTLESFLEYLPASWSNGG